MAKKVINYNSNLIIRISKEQREKISNYAQKKGTTVSELTRQYYETLTNGGNN